MFVKFTNSDDEKIVLRAESILSIEFPAADPDADPEDQDHAIVRLKDGGDEYYCPVRAAEELSEILLAKG